MSDAEDLKTLLDRVDKLFIHKSRAVKLSTYDYTLGRFPYGWTFSVTNSWPKWSAKNLKHEFGAWNEPEYAVKDFLDYVKLNKINVAKLMDQEAFK